ncbi:hypothetical protein ATANTOWER_003881 [Ataeniobius toweri]|uniref:Uncharacterized protein n=1 Tax=Ataeniobius toweri TaxID=208326 RepID=A0ABU7BR27_9TELE|nr:hypothetical protein [Ataeniobius toweri]
MFALSRATISLPGQWSGLGSSNISLAPRERRVVREASVAQGGDQYNQHHPFHCRPAAAAERHTAREERHHQGADKTAVNLFSGSSNSPLAQTSPTTPAQPSASHFPGSGSDSFPFSKQPERVSSSSESLTPGGGGGSGPSLSGGVKRGGGDHHPPSLIPRAVGASTSSGLHSLASRGSSTQNISSSDQALPTPPSAASSSSSSAFPGRLGQPPRGPLSLHSYSRKNVFLQHSLHTAELQALTQRDS